MAAPLSVVVPTLNAAGTVAPLLAQLAQGAADGLVRDVVFSDGGSSDPIEEIAEAVGATFVSGQPGRGGQLRRGVEAAGGDWVIALHADTVLPASWIDDLRRHIETAPQKAAVFRLAFDERSFAARFVAGWANLRTRLFALPYGDQGLLTPRALYDDVGGYPDIPLMEDVAIIRAIGRRRFALLPSVLTTSAERYRRDGWIKRGWKNWRCLSAYYAGVDPRIIAERYR